MFWGDAVEYATYVLNSTPRRANSDRSLPMEIIMGPIPNMTDIVTFGSPRSTYQNPGIRTWTSGSQVGMIIDENDDTKDSKLVYRKRKRELVITTHQIRNVKTLNSVQNAQLQAQLERGEPMI